MKMKRENNDIKKKTLCVLFSIIFLIGIVSAQWTDDLNNDISAFWKMNETTGNVGIDSVTRAKQNGFNNLSLLGITLNSSGLISNGFTFNDSSIATIPAGIFNNSVENFTVSFWLRLDNAPLSDKVVWFAIATAETGIPQMTWRTENTTSYRINFFSGSIQYTFFPSAIENLGSFEHWVLQLSNDGTGNATLWKNGNVIASDSSVSVNFDVGLTEHVFGKSGVLNKGSINATYDEVGWWDDYLSPDKIIQLFNNGSGITFTPSEIIFIPQFPNQIQGEGELFEILQSAGAGLSILFQFLAFALPILLIGLVMVGIIASIGFAIALIIRRFNAGAVRE